MYGNVWFICMFSFVCLDMKSKINKLQKKKKKKYHKSRFMITKVRNSGPAKASTLAEGRSDQPILERTGVTDPVRELFGLASC